MNVAYQDAAFADKFTVSACTFYPNFHLYNMSCFHLVIVCTCILLYRVLMTCLLFELEIPC